MASAAQAQTQAALQGEASTPRGAGLSFSTGIDYSTGDYGTTGDTEILVVPLSARLETGRLALTASLPYIRIEGSGVLVGPGGEPLPGVPTTAGTREGLGDLNLGATYTIPAEAMNGFEFALGGRVKLPTASRSDQITTGETDLAVSGELSYAAGAVTPFVNVGYRVLGDPDGFDLRNGFTASAGASVQAGRAVLIGSYDFAEASSALAEDSHEVFAGLSLPVSSRFTLTGYGVAGLSEGSPDVGMGLLLTTKLF